VPRLLICGLLLFVCFSCHNYLVNRSCSLFVRRRCCAVVFLPHCFLCLVCVCVAATEMVNGRCWFVSAMLQASEAGGQSPGELWESDRSGRRWGRRMGRHASFRWCVHFDLCSTLRLKPYHNTIIVLYYWEAPKRQVHLPLQSSSKMICHHFIWQLVYHVQVIYGSRRQLYSWLVRAAKWLCTSVDRSPSSVSPMARLLRFG